VLKVLPPAFHPNTRYYKISKSLRAQKQVRYRQDSWLLTQLPFYRDLFPEGIRLSYLCLKHTLYSKIFIIIA
jgi:hypothetical protein